MTPFIASPTPSGRRALPERAAPTVASATRSVTWSPTPSGRRALPERAAPTVASATGSGDPEPDALQAAGPSRTSGTHGCERHPRLMFARRAPVQSGRRGSNPRPSAWEADALPTELLPRRRTARTASDLPPEPPVGFEPTTARLRIESSTPELRWRRAFHHEPRRPPGGGPFTSERDGCARRTRTSSPDALRAAGPSQASATAAPDALGQAAPSPSGRRPLQNGAEGTRTPGLLGAIQALSQLSYSPEHMGARGLEPLTSTMST